MPRRGGIFSRIGSFFGDLFKPSRAPEPPERPAPPAPPIEPPGRRYLPPGGTMDRHYRLFMDIPGVADEDEETQADLWDSYVRYMIEGRSRYRLDDPRNPFWSDLGMNPRNFDWAEFRRAYGRAA